MNIIKKTAEKTNAYINRKKSKIVLSLRSLYYEFKKKKLKNTDPTIIASDCFGTFVYHNLGLQFRSPTVNLFFSKEDFRTFVNDLEAFLKAEVTEIEDSTVSYPVGRITANNQEIRINFMHYKSFAEAKEKWDERKKRVSYDNISVIQFIQNATADDIHSFESLPYENKMLITGKNITHSKCVVTHRILKKKDYVSGEILQYPTINSIKKNMDSIDYVSFLNNAVQKGKRNNQLNV